MNKHSLIALTALTLLQPTASHSFPFEEQICSDAGIVAVTVGAVAGTAYLLHRWDYAHERKQAHARIAALQDQMQRLEATYTLDGYLLAVHNLQSAQASAYDVKHDAKSLHHAIEAIESDINAWNGYEDYNNAQAQAALGQAYTVQRTLNTLSTILEGRMASYALAGYYQNALSTFASLVTLKDASEDLHRKINGSYYSHTFPLMACLEAVQNSASGLRAHAAAVTQQDPNKMPSLLFAQELHALIEAIVNLPHYEDQKLKKHADDRAQAELALREQEARDAREAQDRLVRAKEQEVAALRQHADAARERARVERERWNDQWWHEFFHGKAKAAPTNVNIYS